MGVSLPLLGVPIFGSGGPSIITDDFDDDSGWLDGNLAPAAMTIGSGRGIWTPTLGSELLANGDMESGDPPDSWVVGSGGTLSSVADERTGGSGAASADMLQDGSAGNFSISQQVTLAEHSFVHVAGWAKEIVAASTTYSEMSQSGFGFSVNSPTWTYGECTAYQHNANPTLSLKIFNGSKNGQSRFDDVSVKKIDWASMFRVKRSYYVSYVEAEIRRSYYSQAGVCLLYDVNNWIVAFLLGNNNLYLGKCVGSVFTYNVATVANTYSAGNKLRLIPAADFQSFSVNYNGAEKIAATAITNFSPAGAWYAGLFNMYNSGNINSDAFDNLVIERVGG